MEKAIENQVTENQVEEAGVQEYFDDLAEKAKAYEDSKEAEEAIERPYNLRKLSDADLFPVLQLLRKLGLKDFKDAFFEKRSEYMNRLNEFNPNMYETDEEKAKAMEALQKKAGLDIVMDMAEVMISKIETHKKDIYGFYSTLSGLQPEEIMQMEFGTLPLMIYDSFSEVKNTAFFKVLSKLL